MKENQTTAFYFSKVGFALLTTTKKETLAGVEIFLTKLAVNSQTTSVKLIKKEKMKDLSIDS